jgi:NAD(P)-dependent dehydrogenase (short-subunit alcohol dehydrogenase family)
MRKILVLGGTGDIGNEIVKKFANDFVISVGSSGVDLSNKESAKDFAKQHSDFDTIVHCAGYNVPGAFETLDLDELEKSVRTNLLGFLPIVQSNIDHWKTTKTGRVVVVSSLYGFLSRYGRMPYVISKHGLIGFVKTLAIELGPIGATVNAVTPGYINTKMTSKNNTPETIEKIVKGIPVGRMGTPAEIADAIAFLASEQNTYINGHDLVVDGGYSIGGFQ